VEGSASKVLRWGSCRGNKSVTHARPPNADASKGRGVLDSAVDFAVVGAAMDEADYRQSRICRLLGNPVVYQLIVLLEMGGSMTPSKLAKAAGRSVQTVSGHLAKLRAADVVRYDTAGKEVRYWLKHKGEVQGLLKALHKVVHASTRFE
jgi:DNA-binding transcriptional ArsR family regulator